MRTFLLFLAGLLGVLLLTVFTGWWYHTSLPDSRLAQGQELLLRRSFQQAKKIAQRLAADGHPDHAHLLQGQVLLTLADSADDSDQLSPDNRPLLHEALREFNQIQDQGAIRLQAAAHSGQCLLRLHEFAEAERVFRFVIDERPNHVDAHRGLASVYYDLGALSLAEKHLQEVARLDPQDGRPHRLLGLIYKDLSQLDSAAEQYREALKRTLGEATVQQVRVELADVLVSLTRYAEALEQIEGSKPPPAEVGKAVALRAECFWGLGRTPAAKSLLDEALSLNLRVPEVLRMRAKLHLESGEAPSATRLLEEAVALDRHDYSSRHQLALALEAEGKPKEAEEHRQSVEHTKQLLTELTKLTDLAIQKPDDAEVRRKLAAVCQELDKPELAAMWSRAAESLSSAQR